MKAQTYRIGIIGGSGLYNMDGVERRRWVRVTTPYGPPSDALLTGVLAGRDVVFLPRHGRRHHLLPSELNHRANLYALKQLGVAWALSVSAVGSLQERYRPCDIVLPDQFLDRTKRSHEQTYFGKGIVAHVAFAHPVCEELRQILLTACHQLRLPVHDGGVYVNMEGPAFGARAESVANHDSGYDVIGMTNLGEAKCAREAEIAYATLAMVTDYDAWKEDEAHVTVQMVIENLRRNARSAQQAILAALPEIPTVPSWPCHDALRNAVLTPRPHWPKTAIKRLGCILARYV